MSLYSRVLLRCSRREISTSAVNNGKRNFRKFLLYNKRGSRQFKQERAAGLIPDMPIDTRGVREIGYIEGDKFVIVPEMIPELIVPDLNGFELKPYVSYRSPDIYQSEFTAKDLFDAVYYHKIVKDFKSDKLDENGDPIDASENSLTPEEAWREARKTGSDIF